MMPANFWWAPGYNYIPAFQFSGGYELSAEAVPPPLEVSETGGGGSNGARTYSAVPLYGLQLVNPADPYYFQNWPAGAVTWAFIRGEHVSDDPRVPGVQRIPVNDCGFHVTCTFTPPGPGRMEATAWVEGRPVTVRSVIAQPDTLELNCNGSSDSLRITRADDVRCVVAGTTQVTGWDFAADGTGYRNPSGGGAPFTGMEWKGPVVLSGTITVRALVAGQEDTRNVRVTVGPRVWAGKQVQRQAAEEPASASHAPARPDSVQQLGHIHSFLYLELSRDKWEPILSGPNANLAYLVDPPISYEGVIHVNRTALAVGSDFWNAQYRRQRSSGVVDCLQREADITGFIPVILKHEGVGFDPKSHAFLFVTEVERAGNPEFERVVGTSVQDLETQSGAIVKTVGGLAETASARADSAGYAPPWCRFHFNYPR
jgi:hypothetical protein